MDYKALLIKYIQHVESETGGFNYITQPPDRSRGFTPEEWAELEALALVAREME